MKTGRLIRGVLVSLATIGICLPTAAFAAEPAPTPAVVDIALSDGGILHGQVVDLQGSGVTGVPVSVRTSDQNIATATTTADGRFAVPGLRGGVYQVAAVESQGVYRLWSAGTAPPSAQNDAIVYTQNGESAWAPKMLLANPVVMIGLIAAAIAIPVALANSHPSSP